ncbi:DNA-binding SARP family transcriptional activator/tetratricopeptide (TPR) repeat protein [Saccharothrix tamanrassetensis]|uniref:DNA-binding SARP family transcriptional activator/tetratricopeptide (TPR) repeat protein n=1 Tax=Saccharothrix tamanrassetensis TaxID=1051531 RepID=A0A841CJA7_9PSEU|nr:BTAD domain-containing putative transcriptional regulator [Saccharothrix tamanrassetensis]MBB5957063.1 DNA-binding SARP family transcriptional activator/tetratricopeptide (TPR) repeat protein [Saccharothrix tamanrassetensis]
MEFGLLGEVCAVVGGRPADLGPARQRCVLAALAVDVGRVVSVDRLIRRVWGDDPPVRARATLSSYVSRLRRARTDIVLRSGGYVLVADEAAVDLHRFRSLRDRARTADDPTAERLLAEAVGLWRGPALTGLDGDWATAERDRLALERLDAECDHTEVRLRLGHDDRLVTELSSRAAEHPLDERVAVHLLHALYRAGRVADALEHYRRVRARLADGLGTDPGPALRLMHQRILKADPALLANPTGDARPSTTPRTPAGEPATHEPSTAPPSRPAADVPTGTPAARPVPRQLPAVPSSFVGREDELNRLDPTGTTVIAGAGGVGKTWLALRWAHRNAHRFPDGQLFVDLRGFGPEGTPMPPPVAVRGFLDALGVDPGRIPIDPHAQAALFRSLVADKRMLLVVDNAADTAQVTPLLPGGASCTVLVTSRNRLPGLTTVHGARRLSLDVLTDAEAHGLFTARLGADRVSAEAEAVTDLIKLCGGFPLALGIVAGRAHGHPALPLATLAGELRDLGPGALDDDDPTASLPTVLSWSRQALTAEQAHVFGLLGIAPGPDIGLPAAAGLTGLPPDRTRAVLRALEQASLLLQDARGRYRMHDLIRRFAADTPIPPAERSAALHRVVDFHLHTAFTGRRLLNPHATPIDLDPPAPGARPHPLPDPAAALAWFDTEHRGILAAQHLAAAQGRHRTVWQLAWTLTTFHLRRGHSHDNLAAWRTAMTAADHLADPAVQTRVHRLLGDALVEVGRHEEAVEHLYRALALAERTDDLVNRGQVHRTLSWALDQQGDGRQALTHARHALRIYRALDDPAGEADALNGVGWYAARLGEHDEAREHCAAALALHRRHRHRYGEATTLDSLAYIAHHTGDFTAAIGHYREASDLFRELGSTLQAAETAERLGDSHQASGQSAEARAAWAEAADMFRAQGRAEDADRLRDRLGALPD